MFEGSAAPRSRATSRRCRTPAPSLNGSTNADRTNYWEVVPTDALELALWMESDRMGYLLPALTEAKFANQRDVVLNERRQNYENRPYGLAGMAMPAALFPPDHPYHWPTIGDPADLDAGDARRRARVLRALLPSRQRVAGAGRRHRHRRRRWRWSSATSADLPAGPAGRRVRAGAPIAVRRDARSCSRIASSCRGSTWRGRRRRCSTTAMPSSTSRPTCSPTARRRGSIARWCYERARRDRRLGGAAARASSAGFFQVAATAAPGRTLTTSRR